MNLHEESLLKYLLNTNGVCNSTALLKLNNALIASGKFKLENCAKSSTLSYNADRI